MAKQLHRFIFSWKLVKHGISLIALLLALTWSFPYVLFLKLVPVCLAITDCNTRVSSLL